MSPGSTDDSELWSACITGDALAFGDLWDRHRDAVFRAALGQAGNRFDAEDITAITFFEAWRLRARVRVVDGSVLPWLLVTAKNVARNATRSRRRYQAMLAQLPPPPVSHATGDLDTRDRVNTVLHGLTSTDRDLLVLTVIDGYDAREAAERVGISHDAARARLSRMKAKLRAIDPGPTTAEGVLE